MVFYFLQSPQTPWSKREWLRIEIFSFFSNFFNSSEKKHQIFILFPHSLQTKWWWWWFIWAYFFSPFWSNCSSISPVFAIFSTFLYTVVLSIWFSSDSKIFVALIPQWFWEIISNILSLFFIKNLFLKIFSSFFKGSTRIGWIRK